MTDQFLDTMTDLLMYVDKLFHIPELTEFSVLCILENKFGYPEGKVLLDTYLLVTDHLNNKYTL